MKLALTLQQQQASQYEVEVRNANLVVVHGDLGRSFFAWDDNTLKLQLEHFVWLIYSLRNWDIDAGMRCPFARHVDGTGILQPKLMGGDGFGDQFAVVNVRGDSWLFFASEVPNSFPTK